jgi:Zn-dependent protease
MFNFFDPTTFFSRVIILLICLPVHELAHAVTATYFGDETPRMQGRLTINPLVHLDPIGSLLLIFFGFGWAKPVSVDAFQLTRRSSSAVMWVSLAGPLSNFLMAVLAVVPIRAGWAQATYSSGGILPSFFSFLIEFIYINLLLAIFNLIPIAPLDGEKIADYFFPPSWVKVLDAIRPYGPAILLVVFVLAPYLGFNVLGSVINPVMNALMRALGVF